MVDARQDQRAADGAIAVQSGRDTVIQTGITVAEIREVVESLAQTLPAYKLIAGEIVENRLKDFEDRLLEKFAQGNSQANPEAFKNPDFQYLLTRAQHAFARSGEEVTRDTLVDLIAQRSKAADRGRLALTLNDAVEKAAVLTKNEFAELSLCYQLKYTVRINARTKEAVVEYLRTSALPFLPDISRENATYQYLVAQSCASIGFGSISAIDIIRRTYLSAFSLGFEPNEKVEGITEDRMKIFHAILAIPCHNDPSKKQFNILNDDELDQYAMKLQMNDAEKASIKSFIERTTMGTDAILAFLTKAIPAMTQLVDVWNSTPMKQLELTTVGIAIGYANSVRVVNLQADLAIWIK